VSAAIVHANKYDTIESWCETDDPDPTGFSISGRRGPEIEDLATVTCRRCLDAIMKYGGAAMTRSLDLAEQSIAAMKVQP